MRELYSVQKIKSSAFMKTMCVKKKERRAEHTESKKLGYFKILISVFSFVVA
jgi:hypothetical protein